MLSNHQLCFASLKEMLALIQLELFITSLQKHFVVKDCSFEIDSNSKASLSLLHEFNSVVPISIDNCIFNGELSSGAHLIDGNVIKNKNQLSLLNVVSCKFSTGKNGALKLYGRSYSSASLDEGKQEFLLGLQRKSKKSNIGAHLAFLVIGPLTVASAIISLIVATRKRSNDNNELQFNLLKNSFFFVYNFFFNFYILFHVFEVFKGFDYQSHRL